jgi:hypothetical protein
VIALVPLIVENARRIVAGDLGSLEHVSGWPHEDTIDGVRLAESGASVWLVVLDGVVIGDCGTTGPPGREVRSGSVSLRNVEARVLEQAGFRLEGQRRGLTRYVR